MPETTIHPLACVNPNARLGHGVQVGPFATIDDNVEIGDHTIIDSNAVVRSGARIGSNCHIHSGAVVANIPQDLKFKGEDSIAVVGDHSQIREFVTIHRGTASRGKTVVGNNCLIMAYCHVAHDCIIGSHIIMSNASQLAGEVEVGDWAVIGGGTLIHQFVHIGGHVMIQGGSRLPKDVPPYVLAGRDPVSYAGVNSVGLRRRGFTNDQIIAIQDIYRIIFQQGLSTTHAVKTVEEEMPQSNERDIIVDFIKNSPRGIIKGYDR